MVASKTGNVNDNFDYELFVSWHELNDIRSALMFIEQVNQFSHKHSIEYVNRIKMLTSQIDLMMQSEGQ